MEPSEARDVLSWFDGDATRAQCLFYPRSGLVERQSKQVYSIEGLSFFLNWAKTEMGGNMDEAVIAENGEDRSGAFFVIWRQAGKQACEPTDRVPDRPVSAIIYIVAR